MGWTGRNGTIKPCQMTGGRLSLHSSGLRQVGRTESAGLHEIAGYRQTTAAHGLVRDQLLRRPEVRGGGPYL